MTTRHWMPLYIADYLADTAHLSTAEHGAYILLIMHYWTKGSLPQDEDAIRRITRMTVRQWSHSRDLLRSLFGANWSHKRCDHEIAQALEKSKVNSANARRSHAVRTANAQRTHTQSQSQPPKEDKIVEGGSHFTEGSKALASAFWKALGFENPLHIPPQFAGVDWRAVSWESAGWTADMIEAEARRIGPDKPLSYFEKVFATAFAKRQAPLPLVEILEPLPTTIRQQSNGKSGNISAACDKLIAIARANYHGEPPQDPFGFGAHEDTARILSYRRS